MKTCFFCFFLTADLSRLSMNENYFVYLLRTLIAVAVALFFMDMSF